jgi:gamma-glutamylcyclotransferase (GGCT)/AIG2-like uncharacterized protein YtfP
MGQLKMKQCLFVYGTLGPKGPNQHVLMKIGGAWLKGSVRGRLGDVGWGAEMGYPAIELDTSAATVDGHVFVSDNISKHWDELDAFEGIEYERVLTKVKLEDQTSVEAYIYVSRVDGAEGAI